MRGVMARFYAAVREPVERHGGTVEKVIGDALMAVFGIPTVHEDDALRALRAALEMRDAVREMGEIQARIGVNTGDVLARDPTQGESLVVGDAVNVAARLEQAAEPGEVLVGEATWALVGHAAHGEQVAPIAAKGKREPVAAWRLEGVDPEARGQRRRLDLPMIGRDAELDLLRWALDRASRAQRPHLVTVVGQPGIGKSRLVSELRPPGRRAHRAHRSVSCDHGVVVARAAARGGARRDPRRSKRLRGDRTDHGRATRMPTRSRRVFARAPARRTSPGRCHAWSACSPRRETVVVVLEDVHWASGLLLDVVEQLLGDSRRRALLVVCTTRPELADRRPGWGTGANTVSVALERLDDTETRRLLTYASPGLGDEQARQIIDAAEGNPLFAEHLAALVGDEVAPAGLPRSLQVLLAARLEALPEPEQEVVGVAAVVGRDFAVDAVEAMVGRPIEAELDRLGQRELTERTAPGRARFGHALLQDAAYGLLPKLRRCELHVSLAHWLAERGASDAEVGDHLEHAYRLRTELELLDDETVRLGAEAGAHLAAAGRRADAMGDPRRARFLLERALALLPERSTERAAALVELAAAGWNLLQREELSSLLSDGADLAAELGARAVELRARLLLLGAVPEDAPELHGRARDDPSDERRPRGARGDGCAACRRDGAQRPRQRPSGGWARRRRASSRCAGRSPSPRGRRGLGLGDRNARRCDGRLADARLGRRAAPGRADGRPRHPADGQVRADPGSGDSGPSAGRCRGGMEAVRRRRGDRAGSRPEPDVAPRSEPPADAPQSRPVRRGAAPSGVDGRGVRASRDTRGRHGHAGVAGARRGPAGERHGGGHRRPHGPRPGGVRRTRTRRRCGPTWRCRRWASRRPMWTVRSAPRVRRSTSPRRATG